MKTNETFFAILLLIMPRWFELFLVLLTLPLWLPVIGGIALVLLCTGQAVFFYQVRPGLKGKPFRLRKFCTMRAGEGSDEARMTRVGRFLRRTSLDELPELFHVLSGKMALVGPRPLLVEYLEIYTEEEHHRHDVRPGITGWAQINGRTEIELKEKVALDLVYVKRRSFAFDLKILFLTLFHLKGK
jgi:lipopolysaccharide/colanic/teichoic acid biosynthesis glycosyltransferase